MRSAANRSRLAAGRLDLLDRLARAVGRRVVVHRDAHAARAERDGDRAADAVPRYPSPAPFVRGAPYVDFSVGDGYGSLRARANATILSLEPLGRHAHHAERARPFGRAVPIGSAARHQRKVLDQRAEPRDVFGRMTRVPDFDAVDPLRDERLDAFARARVRRDARGSRARRRGE